MIYQRLSNVLLRGTKARTRRYSAKTFHASLTRNCGQVTGYFVPLTARVLSFCATAIVALVMSLAEPRPGVRK